jgi:hypothetical protein
MKTNQIKLRQSCRKNRAIKAGDFVVVLRMTRRRQMQRRNKSNRATSTPHEHRFTNQSCEEYTLTLLCERCFYAIKYKLFVNDFVVYCAVIFFALHLHSPSREHL